MTFVARLLSFIGRLCFVLVFVVSGFHHVSNFDAEVESMKAVPFFTITQTVDYLPIILGFAFGLQLLGSLLVVFNSLGLYFVDFVLSTCYTHYSQFLGNT